MGYVTSSIGKKQLMGVTGLLWAGFVLSHMLGNLLIIVGPYAYNKYAMLLTSNPLLYIAEAALLITLLIHVVDGVLLTARNKWARPNKYTLPTNGSKAARFQSKWMIFHGSLILVFLILHIAAFKYGPGASEGYVTTIDGTQTRDLYKLVVERFQEVGFLAWYVVAMVFVGLHLSHGFYSSFASLGIYHPKLSPLLSRFGYVYAAVIFFGFIVPPLYVFAMNR